MPLTGDQGVKISSKPDFVFRPQRNPGRQPVAVFTDGKSYHIDIAGTDAQKRMAIREGLGWNVWSLTWQDVMEKCDRKEESTAKEVLAPEALASADLTKQALGKHHLGEVSKNLLLIFCLSILQLLTEISCSVLTLPQRRSAC